MRGGGVGADVFQVAAEAGKGLAEGEGRTGRGLPEIVQVVVGIAEAQDRAVGRARRQQHVQRRARIGRDLLDLVGVAERDAGIFRDRKAGAQHARGHVALVGGLFVIGLHPVQVKARRQVAVQEVWFGEGQLRGLGDVGGLQRHAQVLAAAEHVGFGVADFAQKRGGGRIAQAHRQRAGGLLGHVDGQVGAVGLAAGHVLDVHVLEEAQAANAGARAVNQHAVEGIAFLQAELAADDAVQRAGVARNVDLLDIDARALDDLETQINRMGVLVALDARMDLGKGIALGARGVGQGVNRLLHRILRIGVAFLGVNHGAQRRRRQFADLGIHGDLAELVAHAFINHEVDVEAFAVGRQLGHRAQHLEVGIAPVDVEAAQAFAVELQAVGIVIVVAGEELVPARFLGGDLALQRVAVIDLVAGEADATDAGGGAVGDGEDQVHAVLRPLDDLRVHPGRELAVAPIDFDDALDVGLHLGAGEHGARLDLDFLGQVLVRDLGIALEHHLVDDRVLGDADGQGTGGAVEAGLDVAEQAGGRQRLQRRVGVGRGEIVPLAHADIGQHRAGLHALGAAHHDMLDHTGLGLGHACPAGIRRGGIGSPADSRLGVGIAGLGIQFLGAVGGAGAQLGAGRAGRQHQAQPGGGGAQQAALKARSWQAGPHQRRSTRSCGSRARTPGFQKRFSRTRSFQVVRSINPNTRTSPSRNPTSWARSPSGRPKTASTA